MTKILKDFYAQPEKADFDLPPLPLPRCFVFDYSGNVVIFDFVFDNEMPEDVESKMQWQVEQVKNRAYILDARTTLWINDPSGHASENAGFIVYPFEDWIDALVEDCTSVYVSKVLKTLVDAGLIKSFTV